MTRKLWLLRARELADSWYIVVAIVLLIAIAGAGYIAYDTHVEPGVETTEESVVLYSETSNFDHRAEVIRDTSVHTTGDQISSSIYYTSVTPELEAVLRYAVGDTTDVDATIDVDFELVVRTTHDGAELWRYSETIGSDQATVTPGGTAETSVPVNISDIEPQIEAIEDELGARVGSTEVFILANARVSGTIEGETVDRGFQQQLAIDPGATTYTAESPDPRDETYHTLETTTEPVTYGPLRSIGPLLAILMFVGALGGLTTAKYYGHLEVSQAEKDAAKQEKIRHKFDDWISSGSIGPSHFDNNTQRVRVASLEDLVDVAIDSNRRVIEDQTSGQYYVIDEGVLYTYTATIGSGQYASSQSDGALKTPEDEGASGDSVDTAESTNESTT